MEGGTQQTHQQEHQSNITEIMVDVNAFDPRQYIQEQDFFGLFQCFKKLPPVLALTAVIVATAVLALEALLELTNSLLALGQPLLAAAAHLGGGPPREADLGDRLAHLGPVAVTVTE